LVVDYEGILSLRSHPLSSHLLIGPTYEATRDEERSKGAALMASDSMYD
jgi:hypothetical protein